MDQPPQPPNFSEPMMKVPLPPQPEPYDPNNPATQITVMGAVTPEDGPVPDPVFLECPTFIVCPNCNYRGASAVEPVRGLCSLFCYICSWCCVCFQDIQHSCPRCKIVLGTYQKL